MERNVSTIRHITPASAQWTTLVQIIDQTKELRGKLEFGKVPYKRVTITDAEGTKAIAIIRGQDIQYFESLIQPYRRYYVSNAIISMSSDIDRDANYPYSWLITNKTVVEPYVEAIPPSFSCDFEITKFKDLFRYADTNNVQNVQGVVIAVLPSKRRRNNASSSRDFVIVNEEKRPMLLTLWKEFENVEGVALLNQIASRPAILAMRIKVSTFNGLQLGTWFTTTISINLPKDDIAPLLHWCNSNIEELNEMVANNAYKNIRALLPPRSEEDVNKISEGIHLQEKNARAIWIKGTISLLARQSKFWYTACAHCDKAVEAENSWNFFCTACNMRTNVETRIGLLLNDMTGTISTMSFGHEAEAIIPFSPTELRRAYTNGVSLFDQISQHLEGKTFYCFMRHYNYNFQGHDQRRHIIVVTYTEEEVIGQTKPQNIKESTRDEKAPEITISHESNSPLFTPKTSQLLTHLPKTLQDNPHPAGEEKTKRTLNFSDTDSDSSEKSTGLQPLKYNVEEIVETPDTTPEKKASKKHVEESPSRRAANDHCNRQLRPKSSTNHSGKTPIILKTFRHSGDYYLNKINSIYLF